MPRLSLLAPLLLAAAAVLAGCGGRGDDARARAIGDPDRGVELTRAYGCVACHEIPGVTGAQGRVGPPLTQMGSRTMIAGVLPNTPSNMIRWLRYPQRIVPGNAMPNTELSEHDARDIAAFLETLR